MPSINANGSGNEVARQRKNNAAKSDTRLLKLCVRADAAYTKAKETSGDEGLFLYWYLKASALLDKILPISPVSKEGLLVKTAFTISIGYQWPTLQGNIETSDIVVATLLRDVGIAQPTFGYRPLIA